MATTELEKIVLTSALTVVGGSLVFVLQHFVLEPLNEQSKVLGRIAYAIYYYGQEYNSPIPIPIDPTQAEDDTQKRYRAAANQFWELGAALVETSQSIRLYWLWVPLRLTPRRKRINEAIGLLTRMSRSFFAFDHATRMEYIRQNWADADEILRLLPLKKWGK
jgi:hypothetical protein